MRHRYHKRPHRVNRGMLALLLVLITVFLVSCVAGSDPMWVRSVFGLNVVHYESEPVLASCATDGAEAAALCDLVDMLTTGSLSLRPFNRPSQAVAHYRDAILNDMLRDHYMQYSGNGNLLGEVAAAYPQQVISMLIPKQDFEETVTRCFGSTSVRHKSGQVFDFLDRVDGYTAPIQAWESQVEIAVERLEQTEHTWRMAFRLCRAEEQSSLYTAVFVRRDDGSCYFYSLDAA